MDFKDAYLHIPIQESSQRYLRLADEVEGKEYYLQCRALPFGLSSSLRIFTKVLAEAMAPLRLKTMTMVPYLDYLLFCRTARSAACKGPYRGPTMVEVIGVGPQHRQIKPSFYPEYPVFGISAQFNRAEDVSAGRKNSEFNQENEFCAGQTSVNRRIDVSSGSDDHDNPARLMGRVSPKSSTSLSSARTGEFRQNMSTPNRSKMSTLVVKKLRKL